MDSGSRTHDCAGKTLNQGYSHRNGGILLRRNETDTQNNYSSNLHADFEVTFAPPWAPFSPLYHPHGGSSLFSTVPEWPVKQSERSNRICRIYTYRNSGRDVISAWQLDPAITNGIALFKIIGFLSAARLFLNIAIVNDWMKIELLRLRDW